MDTRLAKVSESHEWFQSWEKQIQLRNDLSKNAKQRSLITNEAREDLDSCIIGFTQLVKQHTKNFPGAAIIPSMINTDVVENVFCQQRSVHNGGNTHPNLYQYRYTLNTILFSGGLKKRSGNAATNSLACKPFVFEKNTPLKPKKLF